MRHNYLQGKGANARASKGRRHLMHVLGEALRLEQALRGLAAATGPGPFAEAMTFEARHALSSLAAVQERVPLPPVAAMLAAAGDLALEPGQGAAAATAVAAAAADLAETTDEAALVAIDGLVARDSDIRGTPRP